MASPGPGDVISVLRYQAWERAKGELSALLQTYMVGASEPSSEEGQKQFEEISEKIQTFIRSFEDHHF